MITEEIKNTLNILHKKISGLDSLWARLTLSGNIPSQFCTNISRQYRQREYVPIH